MLIPGTATICLNSYRWDHWDWNLLERWIGWCLAWHNLYEDFFHRALGCGIGWSWECPSILFCRWVVRVYSRDYSVRNPWIFSIVY